MKPCAVALLSVLALSGAPAMADETLHYRWNLGGFFGTVARVFLPGRGDGELVTTHCNGRIAVQLDITAPAAAQGEFWRYGAEIDPLDGRTLKAWSAYRFRGEDKSKESDLEEAGVIDIASGILMLRRDQPTERRNLRIWSDGKIYPVEIIPRGYVMRSIGGRQLAVRHYAIRARRLPGELVWKGEFDIYLATDEVATPVEITMERRMARVRLVLEPSAGGD